MKVILYALLLSLSLGSQAEKRKLHDSDNLKSLMADQSPIRYSTAMNIDNVSHNFKIDRKLNATILTRYHFGKKKHFDVSNEESQLSVTYEKKNFTCRFKVPFKYNLIGIVHNNKKTDFVLKLSFNSGKHTTSATFDETTKHFSQTLVEWDFVNGK